jgi:hypothetical protein
MASRRRHARRRAAGIYERPVLCRQTNSAVATAILSIGLRRSYPTVWTSFPVDVPGEDPAEQRPDGDRDRAGGAPGTDRPRSLGRLGRGGRQDRECGGCDQRGADAPQRAARDQEIDLGPSFAYTTETRISARSRTARHVLLRLAAGA